MKKILAFILMLTTALTLLLSLTACGDTQGEDGEIDDSILKYFDFELTEDKSAYVVTGYGVQFEEEITIPCDTVLLAMGYIPDSAEGESYADICPVIPIGDSVKCRDILNATREAYEAVSRL